MQADSEVMDMHMFRKEMPQTEEKTQSVFEIMDDIKRLQTEQSSLSSRLDEARQDHEVKYKARADAIDSRIGYSRLRKSNPDAFIPEELERLEGVNRQAADEVSRANANQRDLESQNRGIQDSILGMIREYVSALVICPGDKNDFRDMNGYEVEVVNLGVKHVVLDVHENIIRDSGIFVNQGGLNHPGYNIGNDISVSRLLSEEVVGFIKPAVIYSSPSPYSGYCAEMLAIPVRKKRGEEPSAVVDA